MTMVFDENIPATKLLIDVILNRDIEVITTKAQWDIQSSTPEGHNIRLDIYAKEANGEDLGDGSHIIYVNGAYRGNDPLGKLMQDMSNQGTEGFNYKVIEDGIKHFKENEKGRVAMRDLIEEYAEERAEEMELEIITKLLRKGKDAEEVADLLDLDIERVKSVEEGMLVNS